MNYIEFRVTRDNDVHFKFVCPNKKINLPKNKANIIYDLLDKNNYNPRVKITDNEKIIRFYDVDKNIEREIIKQRKNIGKKVKRTNKFAPVKIMLSATLVLSLYLNSHDILVFGKHEPIVDEQPKYSFAIEETPSYSHTKEENNITPDNKVTINSTVITPDNYFDFEYENRSQTEKSKITRQRYYEIIEKYADMYGLPTNLMVAVATQEQGTHSMKISTGGGFGLFQIQAEGGWHWVGRELTAYNFDTGQNETITVCQDNNGLIDKNMLADLKYNVKVACMVMSSTLKTCNNDMILALQTYNSGTETLNLKEKYGEDWVNHRGNLPGDPLYIEHVLSYIEQEDNVLIYTDQNNNTHTIEVNNVNANTFSKS